MITITQAGVKASDLCEEDLCPGSSYPLGATVYPDGVNFCVFSKNCEAVELLLFDHPSDDQPAQVISLDPSIHKTFYYWHVFVKRLKAGQLYGYRVYGPFEPHNGYRFDGWKLLIDPYARAIANYENYERMAAINSGANLGKAIKSVVIDSDAYDWEGDRHPSIPFSKSIIYELNVRGFTKHPSSGISDEKRGTYLGLIDKIPYLKSLGVTAVELLPVQAFDKYEAPEGLVNYWGYNPLAFFAPHTPYCISNDPVQQVNEFRDMVKAFHHAGMEVILDVVFNHTAEGNENGPTLSLRGFENKAYYLLNGHGESYKNYSGTGNTLNANHSIVRRMILDSLRAWVTELHVDGFRFDLASILSRDEYGRVLENPPILWDIESDPVLAGVKIIAEAWDAAGLYQVGSFIGDKWAEWNGRFRDDVRRFIKGDNYTVQPLAQRILGSPDLFPKDTRNPNRSINFITCHDGFTLNDLVSYQDKHNEANEEGNRDGNNESHSWNCGVEGPTSDPEIEKLRLRQIKNFFCMLMTSHGTPMISMGDEVRRTQQGNNNAYCQDNEISWFDWNLVQQNQALLSFCQKLIAFIQWYEPFLQHTFWLHGHVVDSFGIEWHGVDLMRPDLGSESHSLAYTLHNAHEQDRMHVMLNAYWEPLDFRIPALSTASESSWYRIIDTYEDHPMDIVPLDQAPRIEGDTYRVQSRSMVMLYSQKN